MNNLRTYINDLINEYFEKDEFNKYWLKDSRLATISVNTYDARTRKFISNNTINFGEYECFGNYKSLYDTLKECVLIEE